MSRLWTLVAAGLAGFAVGLPTPPSSEVADSNQCFAETFMLSNTMLGMYCGNHNTANYAYNWTSIDLNLCLGNNGGQLIAYEKGDFSNTCTQCTAASTGSQPDVSVEFNCMCQDVERRLVKSSIDLRGIIYDNDGCMGCFSQMGNKTLAGPYRVNGDD